MTYVEKFPVLHKYDANGCHQRTLEFRNYFVEVEYDWRGSAFCFQWSLRKRWFHVRIHKVSLQAAKMRYSLSRRTEESHG